MLAIINPIPPNITGVPLNPGGVPETTKRGVEELIGVAVNNGKVMVGVNNTDGEGVGVSVIAAVGVAVGLSDGIIVADGLATPRTCSPLLAMVNFLVNVILSPLLSSVVTVIV